MPSFPVKGRTARRAAAVLLAGPAALVPVFVQQASASPSPAGLTHRNIPVCGAPAAGSAACDLILHQVVTRDGKPGPSATTPSGYGPSDIISAYGWSSLVTATSGGANETIAVVDAYDNPNAAADLTYFSNTYGLPTTSTTTCPFSFTKVNQNGGSSLPRANSGWALEESLDVEWAHAIAPCAKIVLVEASSASNSNLFTAEDTASGLASYVTNSWGGGESSNESSYDSHFSTSGVSYFASAGDTGGAVEYPSASPDVISAGGTTLTKSGSGWSQSAWSSGGGGCSAYENANPAQWTGSVKCSGKRATPDVSSDANPNTGVAVYDSTQYQGQSGWLEVGGTSAASPVLAARAADQGGTVDASWIYAGLSSATYPSGTNATYWDVVQGSNGYQAGPGYDLATGLGSWGGSGSGTTSTSPAQPTGLAASNVGSSSLSLTWSETGTTSGYTYNVYGSQGTSVSIDSADLLGSPSQTSFNVTGLTANTTYTFAVVAVNSSGSTSAASQSITVTTGSGSTSALVVSVGNSSFVLKGPNYHLTVTVTVQDGSGAPVGGAAVTLSYYAGQCPTVGSPTGAVLTSTSGTTSSSGTFSSSLVARSGTYCAWADASANGSTGSGYDTITLP